MWHYLGRIALACLLVLMPVLSHGAETELADPPPSMMEPRQIVMTLNSAEARKVNDVFYNLINTQKFYGMDNVELVLVAYGAGVRALLQESAPVPDRVQSLQSYGIRFIACGNTLDAMHKSEADLLEGVDVVEAGLPEIVERSLRGWVIINP